VGDHQRVSYVARALERIEPSGAARGRSCEDHGNAAAV
jgi:hypothetical protein